MSNFKNVLSILNEEFTLKKTSYEEIKGNKDFVETSFIYKDNDVYVKIVKGDVIFKVNEALRPSEKNITIKNYLEFFSQLMYVVFKMIEKVGLTEIKFIPSEIRLKQLYNNIFKNHSFFKVLDKNGFEYSKTKYEYIVRKKDV